MRKLEQELEHLKQRVAEMGDLTQSMVAEAIAALSDPHEEGHYQRVLAGEDRLDQMQLDVDKEAIRLLTVYGPVAANLRLVLSVTRINSELERIGDQTVSMCNHIQLMASKSDVAPLAQFRGMAKLIRAMLYDALKAFRLDDSGKAKSTMANDDLVDVLNDEIVRELLSEGRVQSPGSRVRSPGSRVRSPGSRVQSLEPRVEGQERLWTLDSRLSTSVAQIMISQSLERIGDQACNVCEQIVYMVEGADIRHQLDGSGAEDHRLPAEGR